jgi:hypothetical protein
MELFQFTQSDLLPNERDEKGVKFLSEPYEINTGLAAEFEDPFGNRLGITDYSKAPQYSKKA